MGMIKRIIQLINREFPTETLIRHGLTVGEGFTRQQGCFIDPSHCWLIEIGQNVTFSIRVTVLAHDASMKNRLGYARIGRVVIGDDVFIGANATILPGVHIGDGAIIGANAVITKDVPAGCVAAGNPARVIYSKEEWEKRIMDEFNSSPQFGEEYTERRNVSSEMKKQMKEIMKNTTAFIE